MTQVAAPRWIAVDPRVVDDEHVIEASEMLGVSPPVMVGYLVVLWGTMSEQRPTGSVALLSPRTIAAWSRFDGDADRFVAALKPLLNDADSFRAWPKYQGARLAYLERERARKRRGDSTEVPDDELESSAPTGRGTETGTGTELPSSHSARIAQIVASANAGLLENPNAAMRVGADIPRITVSQPATIESARELLVMAPFEVVARLVREAGATLNTSDGKPPSTLKYFLKPVRQALERERGAANTRAVQQTPRAPPPRTNGTRTAPPSTRSLTVANDLPDS